MLPFWRQSRLNVNLNTNIWQFQFLSTDTNLITMFIIAWIPTQFTLHRKVGFWFAWWGKGLHFRWPWPWPVLSLICKFTDPFSTPLVCTDTIFLFTSLHKNHPPWSAIGHPSLSTFISVYRSILWNPLRSIGYVRNPSVIH